MSVELQSKLPQDPDYWDRLAQRVGADAAGPLAAYAGTGDAAAGARWYGLLARRAPWLVAASAAAALLLWLTLPARDAIAFEWINRSLTPSDGAGTLVSGTAPPTVDELLVEFSGVLEEEERR